VNSYPPHLQIGRLACQARNYNVDIHIKISLYRYICAVELIAKDKPFTPHRSSG